MSEAPHIRFEGVDVRYGADVHALKELSLNVDKGEFVFLVGRTGSGKSTLLKLVSREVRPTAGRVLLDERDLGSVKGGAIPALRRQMGIVPQDFGLLPAKRVWENVAYAVRALGGSARRARELVPQILERVSVAQRADAYPHQLSGGEQQRVAIGRALVNSPSLLLADEPTGNLDAQQSLEIIDLLIQLNVRGATVLVATHDVAVVGHFKRRVVTLEEGRVVADEPAHA